MKFEVLQNRDGEIRVRRKFLWWPRTFPNSKEGRWLCFANIREQVQMRLHYLDEDAVPYKRTWSWVELGFAD